MFAGLFRAARNPWSLWVVVAEAGVTLLVSSCSGGTATPTGPVAPSTVNMSLPSATPSFPLGETNDRGAAMAAYTMFWTTVDRIPSLPDGAWQTALRSVLSDPQLTYTLQAVQFQRMTGVVGYGVDIPRVTSLEINGDQATVHDCQDASHSGIADAKTGKPKTVGIPRNPIVATLTRDADGTWTVSKISYPGGTC